MSGFSFRIPVPFMQVHCHGNSTEPLLIINIINNTCRKTNIVTKDILSFDGTFYQKKIKNSQWRSKLMHVGDPHMSPK